MKSVIGMMTNPILKNFHPVIFTFSRRNAINQRIVASYPVAISCAVGLVVLSACGSRYSRWERIAMGLALFNVVFVAVANCRKQGFHRVGFRQEVFDSGRPRATCR